MISSDMHRLRKMKIELTDRCWLNCRHCSSNASIHGDIEIPLKKCLKILDDAAEMDLENVAFSGGEPLLYEDLSRVVEQAVSHSFHVSIYTTGFVDGFSARARDLKDCGVQRLIFSIFSCDENTHESITATQGSFHETCSAISVAAALDFQVELHFVPLAVNYNEIEEIVQLGLQLGASKISALRFVPQGRGEELQGHVLSAQQNIEFREIILKLRERNSDVIRTGSPYNFLMLKEQPQCMAAKDRLTVLPDLRIVPCDAFKRIRAEAFAGEDLYSSLANATLAECWSKSTYLNAVRIYLSTDFAPECKSCEALSMCHSGCLAQKFLSNGDRRKSRDPDCLRGMIPVTT